MGKIEECILYRDFSDGRILEKMCELMERRGMKSFPSREDQETFAWCLGQLLEKASQAGFEGNLWHCYLAWLLVNQENAFSTACEIRGLPEGSLSVAALHDMAIFKGLFDYPLKDLADVFSPPCLAVLESYKGPAQGHGHLYSHRIRDRICALAEDLAKAPDPQVFLEEMAAFYKAYGVGRLGLHKAFRVAHGSSGQVQIEPITKTAHVQLGDLVGYEEAKRKLIENTEAFVQGRRANNCLLFGDAGTGKSSSIKGILNRYYGQGLRIIELYKHQFQDLNAVIAQIKNRNYRFIIYMDDLSFEEFEVEYKYLKAVIEGGLERKPDNILIYATSNRRNLIRERYSDKLELSDQDDLHSSDTVQEKLSLVYRFGLRIYFGAPNKKEYQNIVQVLAERSGLELPQEDLMALANKWELTHGGYTGRAATQLIDHLLGSCKTS